MPCSTRHLSRLVNTSAQTSSILRLPFLYHTRTILQPQQRLFSEASHAHAARPPRIPKVSAKQQRITALKAKLNLRKDDLLAEDIGTGRIEDDRALRARSERAARAQAQAQPEKPKDEDTADRRNAFADILKVDMSRSGRPLRDASMRPTTMTQAEHEIFERLQTISGKRRPESQGSELTDGFDAPGRDDNSLEDIFNRVYELLADQKNSEQRRSLQQQDRAGQALELAKIREELQSKSAIQRALALPTPDRISSEQYKKSHPQLSDQRIDTLESERLEQMKQLQAKFSTVETDLDIWNLLNTHVFKQMKELNILLEKQDEEQRKKAAGASSKGSKQKKKKQQEKPRMDILTSTNLQVASELESEAGKTLLREVVNTYGPALLYAMRSFRIAFPRSPFASVLLPEIKKLGPISYVLAGSTSFYNELLYIRWVEYRDLNGCANLLEEMIAQNILADHRTASVYHTTVGVRNEELRIRNSQRDYEGPSEPEGSLQMVNEEAPAPSLNWQSKGAEFIPFGTPVESFAEGWWHLQGTAAAWSRWTKAYSRIVQLTRSELQRKLDEQALAEQRVAFVGSPVHTQEVIEAPGDPDVELVMEKSLDNLRMASAGR